VRAYLTDRATLYRKTSRDGYGAPQYDGGTEINCKFFPAYELIRRPKGEEEVVARLACYTEDIEVNNEDRIEKDGKSYEVVKVASFEMFGFSYKKVMLA
jgi:hypothetical protein